MKEMVKFEQQIYWAVASAAEDRRWVRSVRRKARIDKYQDEPETQQTMGRVEPPAAQNRTPSLLAQERVGSNE